MSESPLTQEMKNGTDGVPNDKSSLRSRVSKHPLLTGTVVLAGAGLAYAAARALMNNNDASVARDVHIEKSISIDKSRAELYSFWRDFTNLPLFMRNLDSVTVLDPTRSHWVARGPAGMQFEWDAEIYNEIENELIVWRSTENADVVNAGSVRFQKGPTGHGTFVRVTMNYNPPAGNVGASIAQLLGGEPSQLIKDDLRRFKQLAEAGEIPTIDGQTSGRSLAVETESPVETNRDL
ncbi:MAG TPA: SRPBCC family protein [Pyrinomonadaceae bacterium]|nr:SRPBCC family protein [Pyrinomonadaceae bacterium]